jgi:hypothetical protein
VSPIDTRITDNEAAGGDAGSGGDAGVGRGGVRNNKDAGATLSIDALTVIFRNETDEFPGYFGF